MWKYSCITHVFNYSWYCDPDEANADGLLCNLLTSEADYHADNDSYTDFDADNDS